MILCHANNLYLAECKDRSRILQRDARMRDSSCVRIMMHFIPCLILPRTQFLQEQIKQISIDVGTGTVTIHVATYKQVLLKIGQHFFAMIDLNEEKDRVRQDLGGGGHDVDKMCDDTMFQLSSRNIGRKKLIRCPLGYACHGSSQSIE